MKITLENWSAQSDLPNKSIKLRDIDFNNYPIVESSDETGYCLSFNGKRQYSQWRNKGKKQVNIEETFAKAEEERKLNSPFISLEDGESFEGTFVKVEDITGKYGETRRYTFTIGEKDKSFDTKNFSLLKSLVDLKVEQGDVVNITRNGEGADTKYKVAKK